MLPVSVELQIVSEEHRPGRHLLPTYTVSDAFEDRFWWTGSSAKTPAAWCRFVDGGNEVARAKILLRSRVGAPYPSWTPPSYGVTQIELLAVHAKARGQRVGTHAVGRIIQAFPSPVVAMSRDDLSDRFWRSLSWDEHVHEDHDAVPNGCQRLFVFSG